MKMKKLQLFKFIALSVAASVFVGCGGLNTMLKNAPTVTYSVTPTMLEMHGDSVEITITGQYPAKFFNKKAVMDVTPVLKWEGGEMVFRTEKLQGELVEDNGKIIAFESGGNFSYTDKIVYTENMAKSELVLRVKAMIKDKAVEFPEYKLGEGVIATPLLVHLDAKAIRAMDQFKRVVPTAKEADIHYTINQAQVKTSELRQEDIAALKKFIETAKKEESHVFKGINIASYASPDGKEDLNDKLANKRSSSAEGYLKKELQKVEEVKKEGFIKADATAEDWAGFKQLVSASSIEDKELILKVLDRVTEPELREKEIKSLSQAYKKLAEEVLPRLRRSKLVVNVDIEGKSDSVLIAIGKDATAKDTLNVEEFLKAAVVAPSLEEQEAILTNGVARHPEEWRMINNLGYVQVKEGKLAAAQASFEKADELSEGNSAIKNNLGVIAFLNGDQAKANEYFELAAGAGTEVNYNNGIIKIKEGDYQKAVQLFGSNASFNAALAKLLNGDVDGALRTLNDAGATEDPLAYYLKAIIGARTSNTDLLYSNLRTAVAKDSSLATKAKTDMEFAKFFEDDTFKTIIQ